MPRITLLGRPGCHLCDDARAVIERVATDLGVGWEERDITSSPEDMREYWDKIPVTLVDGVQVDFWRVDEARLRAALVLATPGLATRGLTTRGLTTPGTSRPDQGRCARKACWRRNGPGWRHFVNRCTKAYREGDVG